MAAHRVNLATYWFAYPDDGALRTEVALVTNPVPSTSAITPSGRTEALGSSAVCGRLAGGPSELFDAFSDHVSRPPRRQAVALRDDVATMLTTSDVGCTWSDQCPRRRTRGKGTRMGSGSGVPVH